MTSKFKEGDVCVGKVPSNYGLKGKIISIDKTKLHWKFKVKWNNGKDTECGLRSIQRPGVALPQLTTKKRKLSPRAQEILNKATQECSEASDSSTSSSSSSSNDSSSSEDEKEGDEESR